MDRYLFCEDKKERWLGKLNTQTKKFFILVAWHDKTPSLGWCREDYDPCCYNTLPDNEVKRKLQEQIQISVGYNNTLPEQKMRELVEMLAEGEDSFYVLE